MPLFNELMQTKRLQDPEARKPAELVRSEKKSRGFRSHKTSVSVNTMRYSMMIVGGALGLAAIGGIGWLAWKAIELYIGG